MPRAVPSVAVVINVPSHFSPSRPYKTLVQSTAATGGQFIFGLLLPQCQMELKQCQPRWGFWGSARGGSWGSVPSTGSSCSWDVWPRPGGHCHSCTAAANPAARGSSPLLHWPHASASEIDGFVSLPTKGENQAMASLIWSLIKLVYLHSNMNATEYTAKYHSKPECNCPWSQRKAWSLYTYLYKNV